MKIRIERRLPKAPKPRQQGGAHGTRKGKKGYDRKQERRLEQRGEEE